MTHTLVFTFYLLKMSNYNYNIKKQFQDSLERAVRDHLIGNRTGERKNWNWTLRPCTDGGDVVEKLKLILSWVLGSRVVDMTSEEVLKHINYDGYLTTKYGP